MTNGIIALDIWVMFKFIKFTYCLCRIAQNRFSSYNPEYSSKLYMRWKDKRETGYTRAVIRIDLYNKEIYLFNGFITLFFEPRLQSKLKDIQDQYNNVQF